VACPWLIKKFVDAQAEFVFVPATQVEAKARKLGATPFDVAGCKLGQHGDDVSFNFILKENRLTDGASPPLRRCECLAKTRGVSGVATQPLFAAADPRAGRVSTGLRSCSACFGFWPGARCRCPPRSPSWRRRSTSGREMNVSTSDLGGLSAQGEQCRHSPQCNQLLGFHGWVRS